MRHSNATSRWIELHEAEDLIIDRDAEKYGSLTEKAMAAARENIKFDPLNPVRLREIVELSVILRDP